MPGENTTGGKQRLGSITKCGNPHARAMLVQSACLILRSRDSDDPLRRWAIELAKTRGKKIATVALARKLAGVLWAMWRDDTVYDPGFQARQSAKGLQADTQSRQLRAQAMARAVRKFSVENARPLVPRAPTRRG